ncbi:cytoskeletal protein RodZ [Bacillus ectoiniformans]|uniref:YrrS family protein n=1 Tax=Bacillus ectoiniformans TaxID=1494429 RepID=UPI00195A0F49|nr:YrrS family protein [Bacillus ectoiniformans]MBM7649031.1 cytoskeletal protein RodZ [Bacillus ectoiniformans]
MANNTRSERKSKRRKTNRVLNTAIAVVVLLIIVVAFTIFSGGNNDEVTEPAKTNPETENSNSSAANKEEDNVPEEDNNNQEEDQDEKEQDKEQEEVIVNESDEPNVEEEIVDPNWTGVGTAQTEGHTSSFDSDSQDWQEKLDALSYATGIPVEEMTVWYVSGDGPDGAIGTVSPKSNKAEAYRVYITWVDGEGWKPTKVHKLIKNDKGK